MRTLKRAGWAAAGALAAASTGCDLLAIAPELANLPVVVAAEDLYFGGTGRSPYDAIGAQTPGTLVTGDEVLAAAAAANESPSTSDSCVENVCVFVDVVVPN